MSSLLPCFQPALLNYKMASTTFEKLHYVSKVKPYSNLTALSEIYKVISVRKDVTKNFGKCLRGIQRIRSIFVSTIKRFDCRTSAKFN